MPFIIWASNFEGQNSVTEKSVKKSSFVNFQLTSLYHILHIYKRYTIKYRKVHSIVRNFTASIKKSSQQKRASFWYIDFPPYKKFKIWPKMTRKFEIWHQNGNFLSKFFLMSHWSFWDMIWLNLTNLWFLIK